MTTESFSRRIAAMNAMYRLPAHEKPTLPDDTADRLRKFKATLLDEVHEIDDIIANKPKEQLVKGVIDHMAFTGLDLAGTVANLKARSIDYDLRRLPEYGTWQLFFDDPNGAKIELDFDKDERAPA